MKKCDSVTNLALKWDFPRQTKEKTPKNYLAARQSGWYEELGLHLDHTWKACTKQVGVEKEKEKSSIAYAPGEAEQLLGGEGLPSLPLNPSCQWLQYKELPGFFFFFFFSIIPEIRGIPNQLHPPVPVQGNIWSSCLDLSVINLTSASKDVHVCTNSCCWVEVSPLGWFTLQSKTQTSQENHHSLTNILIALSRVIVISGKFLGVGWQRSHKVVNQLVETLNAEFSGQTQCKAATEFCNQKGYRVSYIYTP